MILNPIRIAQPPITLSNQLKQPKVQQASTKSFASILQQEQQLKISKHATQRISQRNINISESEWQQIEEKLPLAKKKGLKDSLFLTKNAALIVNVKNSTVITAMDREEASQQVFTNIDGAIVL
ncbi:MAG: flagellar protein [Kurthia sp.]|nr:flagellar protein [Candidatus Kurthia equi]